MEVWPSNGLSKMIGKLDIVKSDQHCYEPLKNTPSLQIYVRCNDTYIQKDGWMDEKGRGEQRKKEGEMGRRQTAYLT